MKTVTLQSILRSAGVLSALAFSLLLAGCGTLAYNDPNIPANQRYFNTAGAQPINPAVAQPSNQAGAQPINTTGAQPINTTGVQPVNTAGAQPRASDVASITPLLPGGQSSSKLGVGDLLTINFSDPPERSMPREQQHRIGDDGLITLPLNVQVQAAGKTPTQLQQEIRKAYVPEYFVNLTVTVKAQDRFVYVDGEVKVPNRQFHIDGLTVLRAISTAGGFTDFANKKKIEVRRAIGGKSETVNWQKALKNPKLDLPLYVNDQVYVHRRIW